MLRATFFATGLFIALVGASFLFVDSVQLKMKAKAEPEAGFRGFLARMTSSTRAQRGRIVNPPDWAAFSLMSIGAVTMLYAVALPRNKPKEQ